MNGFANRGFFMPAEWAPHERVWLAWPSAAHLWLENLRPAQDEFVRFCQLIEEPMKVLVPTLKDGAEAEARLRGLPISIELLPFGDIWLRDTGCLFFMNDKGEKAYARAAFNGWGGKYVLPFDADLAKQIGQASGLEGFETSWVLEGGSVELDGEGTCLTSRQCLLNQNRNPGKSEDEITDFLKSWLGCEKVLWLNDGLLNDHTDGHVDTIARFVAPGVVACMQAQDNEDPNYQVMEDIARDLAAMTDGKGRKITVVRIPSPGAVLNAEGEVMPASYLNFYIANRAVVVPTYGRPQDEAAVKAIAELFPTRKTTGASAIAILSGGGAFHCMSQNECFGRGPNEPIGLRPNEPIGLRPNEPIRGLK